MNKTESCYQKERRMVTLHTPTKEGQPLVIPVRVKMADGSEKTISRREYKAWRKAQKRFPA